MTYSVLTMRNLLSLINRWLLLYNSGNYITVVFSVSFGAYVVDGEKADKIRLKLRRVFIITFQHRRDLGLFDFQLHAHYSPNYLLLLSNTKTKPAATTITVTLKCKTSRSLRATRTPGHSWWAMCELLLLLLLLLLLSVSYNEVKISLDRFCVLIVALSWKHPRLQQLIIPCLLKGSWFIKRFGASLGPFSIPNTLLLPNQATRCLGWS